jgi:ectoine hydroxylase-related dioxygenase (phytanoyl-CoA dioxygenase family)
MTLASRSAARSLSPDQVEFYREHGYLRIPHVFDPAETAELAEHLDRLIETWSFDATWTGPWRERYMDPKVAAVSQLVVLHDLQLYSEAWSRAISNPGLVAALAGLLGPDVEFHHTTMHVKPPETGMPFPVHQDQPFYPHADDRYVDALLHLDDTSHENGEIRFLDGSHKLGALPHVTETADGPCSPHLPPDEYRLEDTVAVPAQAGDVVCMSIRTIHGSYINTTKQPRRLVRMGYRHPGNRQSAGQSLGRPGIMVSGTRVREEGQEPFASAEG